MGSAFPRYRSRVPTARAASLRRLRCVEWSQQEGLITASKIIESTRPNMSGNMWKGDWAERLSSRVNSLGFDGVDGFVHAFPGETYAQLARRLGSDVAPVQVVRLQLGEVKKKGRLRETARDVLAREIASYLPAGWGSGTDFQTAGAFAAWSATLIVHADAPELQAVTRRVWLALKEQSPPNGWTPQDGDDGVIVKAFDVGWPVS